MALLDIDSIRIEFPSRRGTLVAVDGVSLSLEKGEILGVVGESGAGKSTIGNAVIGLLEAPGRLAGGEVLLEGRRIDTLSNAEQRKVRGRRIGMIFQDPLTSLDPLQTVESQLVETMQVHLDLNHEQARRRAVELLRQVGIDEPELRVKQYPHQFSGGMRQRVVIALALSCGPEVIIADEPTTALDVSIQAQILDLLRKLCREKQVGMIIITHDMGVIADVTDRVAVLYRGKLVEQGPTAKILGNPDHPYTRSLISAVPRPDVKLRRFPVVTYIEDVKRPTVELDIATHWLGQRREFARRAAGPLVEVEDLGMRFVLRNAFLARNRRTLDAVKQVNLSINEGEVFGLVGESGSGKSTVARLIAGLYTPTNGRVLFNGVDLTGLKDEKRMNAFRRQIQMVFQDPYSSLNPRMRVQEIVAEPIRFHRLAEGEAQTRRVVADLLDVVGLGASAAQRYPHEFSGGQRQRICIARALATRPRFLICDEPTSALDVSIQAQILNLLKDLQEQLGLTMLFISHDLPVIRQMCDRVGVMLHGELLETAATETLFTHPQHDYTRHLLSLMPRLQSLQPVASAG
ncbi:dipeptide ABC transporter ATP-binding protein [Bordetella bronchiseptica]|uniref:dipeptide ABC transporter ATP-binding protein n=1 Tax=Bordetella bronchiseptica TaxID=518 RepID=UPI00028FBB19|nr:ABC transporter ATP-binding protein [Bordetella bronchiseptica]KAK54954.1 ABC transporter, ATP-binding protein [Bordetella bronchiseptica OSU054]KAK73532.1 ABC transporter, ATP-binding protein [Bordetella bronchiseptica MO211]KDB74547.1 ABC transporter, ATP-binding protein [Bordetella bronchiseptica CA90 BB1334]KDC18513.1 ABC transporter, ATP-binding protein [Bordetella bronchiseptica E014]KDC95547.1 ABC transporter, ATP-binding protein [Bordetella bronchiseptica MBORD675]